MLNLLGDIQRLQIVSLTVIIRLSCLIIVQSYFVPDEYWQSMEIAHRTAFGYGYVTWEWREAIRSFFYPFWFSVVYKFVELIKLDYVEVLILTPRLLQLILSTVADLYYWEWLRTVLPRNSNGKVYWTYMMWLMCLMVNYCSTRTLTNTAELNFTVIALYYFEQQRRFRCDKPHFLWFVGLACLVRPTAFIYWLPICIYDVLSNSNPFKYCLTVYTRIVVKVLCVSVIVDYVFYKRIVLTPLNFILYNGHYNVGIHYGVHSWFWYVTVGIPIVLGPVFIIFYCAVCRVCKQMLNLIYKALDHSKTKQLKTISNTEMLMMFTIVWSLCWYSFVPHKEFRFILPLVPAMLYLAGTEVDFNQLKKGKTIQNYMFIFISVSAVICNIFGLIYLGQWHQIGPLTVTSKLAQVAKENPDSEFLFLTSCHATPLYSHLHVDVRTRFITCEPNLNYGTNYKDESDLFFENPLQWLNTYAHKKNECYLPSHIIFYDNLKSSIQEFLDHYNYTKYDVVFNTHITQERQSQFFEIYSLQKNNTNCNAKVS